MSGSTPRVGVIGLGRMGTAICGRYCDLGFSVLAHDVRAERAAPARELGAGWAHSVGELASRSDVVLTVLPGPAEVLAVRDPLLGGLARGAAWIEMSSATPATAHQIAPVAREASVRYVDAPLGGDPGRARDGRLLVFAGGSSEDLGALEDVLERVAERVLHVGPAGSGYLTTLLANLLWFGQAIASAEAFAIAARAGLDPRVLRSAIQQGPAAGRFMERDAEALLAGDDMTAFSLAGCHLELTEIVELAHANGVAAVLSETVRDLYAAALGHYGDVDGELLGARLVLERSGITPLL